MIIEKFKKFFQNINLEELLNSKSLFIIASWFLSSGFLFYSLDFQQDWAILWFFVAGYFWVQTNRILFSTLKPPTELVLILLFCIISLDIIVVSNYLNEDKTLIINVLHSVFLTFGLLLTGILLVANSQKNSRDSNNFKIQQRVLIWYGLIGYLAHNIAFYDHIYYLYGFQIILFLVLLKKSTWLESFTKSDLWISFGIILILFFVLPGDNELRYLSTKHILPNAYWISIPYYLYLLLKMYLLVTLVKIPVVMIYNHATLSRKLSIAGLFQSSFPQFIQFLVLIFTFYFFIASWQGDQLRSIVNSKLQSIIDTNNSENFTFYKFEEQSGSIHISIKGYEKINFQSDKTRIAIISLNRSEKNIKNTKIDKDYFFYINPTDSSNNNIYLVKIDTTFIKEITEELAVVVHSGLKAYPFELKPWEKTMYEIKYWQPHEKIKIFPFSIFSNNFGYAIESEVWSYGEQDSPTNIDSKVYFRINRHFVLGRLFFKILNTNAENSYFAIDIYFAPGSSFFSSFIAKIILLLVILSFLFNVFVTKRVIKFGDEIRSIIVRKFNTLKTGIREISSGNLDYQVHLDGEDEFVEFGNHFNQMGIRLKQTLADQRKMDRLDHEFQIARNVQLSLLPTKLPKIPGYNIAASFETAVEVGGDFYDILEFDKNKYLYTIGDVSGKGASAAFYMAQFISLLRYSIQFTKKPEDIADRLNKYFVTHV
ncbi:MAG: SpoIIE family protein phosphatase, partial [Calditrichia bacterium]|nr:SpoIIE family protein phosphatase [Calditrichia bacterium]